MQKMCFVDSEGILLWVVTLAWLAEQTKKAVHKAGCALRPEDWRKGKNLFFNDWIADKRCFKAAMKFMTHDMFPDQTASSLRHNSDGGIQKINKWIGLVVEARCY